VNFTDKQIGVMDAGLNPQDFIGVPFFSPGANYNQGQPVVYQNQLWLAATTVTAGPWNATQWTPAITQVPPLCGRLTYVSQSLLNFGPYNGDRIRINGVVYPIPVGGIYGLGNSNISIDGSPNKTLAASTRYYVYCYNNAGVLTADYSTTGHSSSTTSGNIGTEIKTGDETRSLIGMIVPGSNGQFFDQPQFRYVRSWFNRQRIYFASNWQTWGPYGPSGLQFTGQSANFVAFAGEALQAAASGAMQIQQSVGTNWGMQLGLDGNLFGASMTQSASLANYYLSGTCTGSNSVSSDGLHWVGLYAQCTAGYTISGQTVTDGTLG
jgi:hypothetical protein